MNKEVKVELRNGKWVVNGIERNWTDHTPFYVVYYGLRWIEGYKTIVRVN